MKKLVAIVLGVALAGVGTVALATRNSSGTHTLPAGNPVTPGTSISTTWANNTLGDISQALTDSLDRNGKGGMLAPLRTPNGSVSAPTHSFTNDTDTGLYLVGDANPAVAVAGTKREEWTSAGAKVTGTFEVTGASTLTGVATFSAAPVLSAGATLPAGDITMTKSGVQGVNKTGGTLWIGTGDANQIELWANGNLRFFVNSTGVSLNGTALNGVGTPVLGGDAANKTYVDTAAPAASKVLASAKIDGATPALRAGAFGISAFARVGGAPAGRYQMTVAGATNNSIVIVTPGNNGSMGAGLVLAGGVSGTTVSVDARNNTGTFIDAEVVVTVLQGGP